VAPIPHDEELRRLRGRVVPRTDGDDLAVALDSEAFDRLEAAEIRHDLAVAAEGAVEITRVGDPAQLSLWASRGRMLGQKSDAGRDRNESADDDDAVDRGPPS
jgi:hypothetical protein